MSQLEVDKIIPQSGTTLTIGDSGDTISFADGATLAIDTNTLAIDSTNNRVGIGTSSPDRILHLEGALPIIKGTDTDGGYGELSFNAGRINIKADDGNNVATSYITFEVDGSEHARIDSSGRVGIGTTNPSAELHIKEISATDDNQLLIESDLSGGTGTDTVKAQLKSANRFASFRITSNSSYKSQILFGDGDNDGIGRIEYDNNGDYMQFKTNTAEAMRIDSSGNVGIGTSSPTSPLHVAKSGTGVWFQTERTDAGGFFTISHNSQKTYFNTEQDYIWSMNGTEAMRIDTSRTVLINTTSNPLSSGLTVSVPGSTGGSGEQGWGVTNAGAVYHQTDLGNQMLLNDSSASAGTHNYVLFRYGGATIGDIDTTDNSTIRYNTFTGGHWSQFHDGTNPELKRGTVMSLTGDKLEYSKCEKTVTREDGTEELQKFEIAGTHEIGSEITVPNDEYGEEDSTTTATVVSNSIADHLVKVKVSDSIADKAVYGVWAGKYNDGDLSVEALGTSKIRIKQGEVLEVGDLLESAGDGTAQKQSDDIIKNSTIAKVTSPIAIETFDDNSFLVSCVLYCG